MCGLYECFTTHIAAVTFLPSMDLHVCSQIGFLAESLATCRAFMVLFPCVGFHVSLQLRCCNELFPQVLQSCFFSPKWILKWVPKLPD